MGAQQLFKVWILDIYVPLLYSWNIAESDDKPQQTIKAISAINFIVLFFKSM